MIYVWAAAILVLVIIEIATVQLVTIWFALGAAAALAACALHAPLYVQLIVFIVSSLIFLVITRPLASRLTKTAFSPTNADRYLGKEATVLERIDNLQAAGSVKIDGVVWTARSENGEPIEADTVVIVQKIDGVKLIVKEKSPETANSKE